MTLWTAQCVECGATNLVDQDPGASRLLCNHCGQTTWAWWAEAELGQQAGQHATTGDRGATDPRFEAFQDDRSQLGVEVNLLEKGQRVRLGGIRWDLASRLGSLGTVIGHDQAHVLVDLDVGGPWWLKPEHLTALKPWEAAS